MYALHRVGWAIVALLVAGGLFLSFSARFLTDWMWFGALGFSAAFWTPLRWVWGLRLGVGAILAAFYFVNLRLARPALARAMFQFQAYLPQGLRWGAVTWLFGAASAVLGFLSSAAFALYWESVAAYIYREPTPATDPLFSRPIGFYLFELPFWRLVESTAMGVFVLTALIVGTIYVLTRSVRWEDGGLQIERRARVHLGLLGAGILGLKAWSYRLDMYGLVYGASGVIYGAGYTDVHARLPVLWILLVLAAIAAGLALLNVVRTAVFPFVAALGGLIAASVLIGVGYPALVQQFIVAPNELERERPYIEDHLEMTRQAFGLDRIIELDLPAPGALTPATVVSNQVTMENIRLWDWRPLLTTYAQLQEIRLYYDFRDVDIDRYRIDGRMRQVMLAAREMSAQSLPNPTWINQHLQYTHGYGVVVSPVNEVTPEGLPVFLVKNIPPESTTELVVTRPEIYYGEATDQYVIVNTRTLEFDYPQGDDNAFTSYQGTGGVPLSDPLRRILFALRLGTLKVLLSQDITSESRVMIYRNIRDRVQRIAPFLRYDADPYLVVSEGRLYWMWDAYTTSDRYPYSLPVRSWGNYVRNAVKVVIDAYEGGVQFFVADPSDPLIRMYQKLYPTLFSPISEMPPDLFSHRRYPEDLFALQAQLLTVYHMENPTVFYNREDAWSIPMEIYGNEEVPVQPYYVVMRLPGEREVETVLMIPFTPRGKDNMVAWLAARNDGEVYGELRIYQFPKQSLTFGPMQIESRINQDARISQLLALWSQEGSRVIRGNLLVIPMGDAILYVEPLYLRAQRSELPELKRVIVASGSQVAIGTTLAEAVGALAAGTGGSQAAPVEDIPGLLPPLTPDTEQPLAIRALELFDLAQSRLRAGEWAAYGQALQELRRVLEELAAAGG